MPRRALVTVVVQGWTGWTREQPKAKSVQLAVEDGQKLTPATVGIESWPYEITVASVRQDRIIVFYNGMVIKNDNGTINLSASTWGQCIIRIQHCMRLASATMDAGTSVYVTLERIESDRAPATGGAEASPLGL